MYNFMAIQSYWHWFAFLLLFCIKYNPIEFPCINVCTLNNPKVGPSISHFFKPNFFPPFVLPKPNLIPAL